MSPTVVLIHGAFADASGWGGVISRLSAAGITTYAPANPLRGVSADSAYVRSFVSTIEGPVILVGHSYGGAVITNAAVGAENVTARRRTSRRSSRCARSRTPGRATRTPT